MMLQKYKLNWTTGDMDEDESGDWYLDCEVDAKLAALEAENERLKEAHLAIFSIAENAIYYFVDQPSAITVLDEIRHEAGQFLTAESEVDDE